MEFGIFEVVSKNQDKLHIEPFYMIVLGKKLIYGLLHAINFDHTQRMWSFKYYLSIINIIDITYHLSSQSITIDYNFWGEVGLATVCITVLK